MRRLIYLFTVLVTSVLSTSPTWAENPYTALSAPELRTKIARIGAVHEQSWYQVEVLVFARTLTHARAYILGY